MKPVNCIQTWARLFLLYFVLMFLQKAWIHFSFPLLWVNNWPNWVLSPCFGNQYKKKKIWIKNNFSLLKNWPFITSPLSQIGWEYSYLHKMFFDIFTGCEINLLLLFNVQHTPYHTHTHTHTLSRSHIHTKDFQMHIHLKKTKYTSRKLKYISIEVLCYKQKDKVNGQNNVEL